MKRKIVTLLLSSVLVACTTPDGPLNSVDNHSERDASLNLKDVDSTVLFCKCFARNTFGEGISCNTPINVSTKEVIASFGLRIKLPMESISLLKKINSFVSTTDRKVETDNRLVLLVFSSSGNDTLSVINDTTVVLNDKVQLNYKFNVLDSVAFGINAQGIICN